MWQISLLVICVLSGVSVRADSTEMDMPSSLDVYTLNDMSLMLFSVSISSQKLLLSNEWLLSSKLETSDKELLRYIGSVVASVAAIAVVVFDSGSWSSVECLVVTCEFW